MSTKVVGLKKKKKTTPSLVSFPSISLCNPRAKSPKKKIKVKSLKIKTKNSMRSTAESSFSTINNRQSGSVERRKSKKKKINKHVRFIDDTLITVINIESYKKYNNCENFQGLDDTKYKCLIF